MANVYLLAGTAPERVSRGGFCLQSDADLPDADVMLTQLLLLLRTRTASSDWPSALI